MATTVTNYRRTPGVYVTEFPAFPQSIVGVETAVPIFIGYTETAVHPENKQQLYGQAVPLSSMVDYHRYFGHGFADSYVVSNVEFAALTSDTSDATQTAPPAGPAGCDFQAATSDSKVASNARYIVRTSGKDGEIVPRFNLYATMQAFFVNGGGNCFVVSVANYWGTRSIQPPTTDPTTVDAQHLLDGLAVASGTSGPTMLVVPDACLLTQFRSSDGTFANSDAYGKVVVAMLQQASALQDRVAILDLPSALDPECWNKTNIARQAQTFYTAIAPAQGAFSYGVAYAPAVETTFYSARDLNFLNLHGSEASIVTMNNVLTTQAAAFCEGVDAEGVIHETDKFKQVANMIGAAFPVQDATSASTATTTYSLDNNNNYLISLRASLTTPTDPATISSLNQSLVNAVPLLGQVLQILVDKLNVLPPSGILAGIWTAHDANRGVWTAPANVALNDVIGPKVVLTDADQGDYNMPPNGNAINILRAMINRGTVVWGTRTLDGNSLDYRYVQVRRTLIYIEQWIKLELQQFVFAPNDGGTWATVTASISNFLTQLWQSGGLMGDKASDAFVVKCGIPAATSGLDVVNGYMIVNVAVQMIHPAEFIELTFAQIMQGSNQDAKPL